MIEREVTLTLGDKTYHLQATLNSMLKVNSGCGSLMKAYESIKELDFEAICLVVAAGAGLNQKQTIELQQAVFEAGIGSVATTAAEFVGMLLSPTGAEADNSGK